MKQTSNYISENTDGDIIKWEGGGSGNNRDSNDLPTAKVADRAQLRPNPLTHHNVLHDKYTPVENVNMLDGGYNVCAGLFAFFMAFLLGSKLGVWYFRILEVPRVH